MQSFQQTNTSTSLMFQQNSLSNKPTNSLPPVLYKPSQTIYIKQSHVNDIVLDALHEQREEVFLLEKQLYECINLKWGVDIITEDVPIIDGVHDQYYMNLLRTAKPVQTKKISY